MTTLQKALIAATLVAAVGAGIYQACRATSLQGQIRSLQEQQAEQIQQLQRERDGATAKLAALQAENERLSRNSAELLKLRGEVARLRKDLQNAEFASRKKLEGAKARPVAESAMTNLPPVETYSATVRAVVPWNQTVVTGGWMTPAGKRAYVFAVPKRGEDATQLEIQACIVEIPDDAVTKLGLNQFTADGKEAKAAGLLASDQYATLLKTAEGLEGVTLLSAPRVTTLSGRQAQIQVVDLKKTPAGQEYSVGPVLDFTPTISTDGGSVELGITANVNYPSRSSKE